MSRDATWVVNTCAKFECDMTVPELEYNFPLTASLQPQFLRFFGGGGVNGGQISNAIYLSPKRHFRGENDLQWRTLYAS